MLCVISALLMAQDGTAMAVFRLLGQSTPFLSAIGQTKRLTVPSQTHTIELLCVGAVEKKKKKKN